MTQAPSKIRYRTVKTGPATVFYREAGDPRHPAVLLLHGFPTSSHMFRNLIPLLADRYHVVAPDLPGFGFTVAPDRQHFAYKFDNLAKVIEDFTVAIGLKQLRHLRLRLRRSCRLSSRAGTSGSGHRHHLTERQRL